MQFIDERKLRKAYFRGMVILSERCHLEVAEKIG